MDFLVPYSSARRSPAVKTKLRNKTSKLSLKSRQKTSQCLNENKIQSLASDNRHPLKTAGVHSVKDLYGSLISSDESNHEDKLLGDSTFFERSQFQVPQAESTRLDSNKRHSNDESNPASFFSCKSRLTPASGSSSDTEELDGACEDSIIYVSDDESLPLLKLNRNPSVVIPESTESDFTDEKSKQLHIDSKNKTIVLDSSSEDDSSVMRKKLLVGKTVLSTLNNCSKNQQNQWKNIVIPTSSSCSDESNDVIDSSVHTTGLVQKNQQNQWKNIVIPTSSSCSDESNDVIDSSVHTTGPVQKKDRIINTPASSESPIKKPSYKPVRRRKILNSSEEETSVQDEEGISLRKLAAEKLSQTKVVEIQRWIDGNASADSESLGTDSKDGKSSTVSVKSPQRQDSNSSSDDSFDDLIRRERKPPKKTPAKSSFIVDDSDSSSGSYSNYRRFLTADIKQDVKVDKTPFRVPTGKPAPRVRRKQDVPPKFYVDSSESDAGSSSSSDWDSDFSSDKRRRRQPGKKVVDTKPLPKLKQPIPDSRKAGLDDTWELEETPKTVKKPVNDTPRTSKKPVDDTPKAVRKPVENTPRTLKKPVENTPRTVKKPAEDTPRTLKKPTEDKFSTPLIKPNKGTKNSKVEELKKTATPYSPIRTFLTSLSGPSKDPNMRSHPEASIYFKNFKSKKEELARRLFKLFNREVFDSRLPDDMVLEWSGRMSSTAGYCSCKLIRKPDGATRIAKIVLSSKILVSADRLRDTLIHELCHAAVWLLNHISGGHGPFWKAWASKAERRFPELPAITRCHQYDVETKFTYRCTNCGYSFGRNSKSINLETQKCGHCYGTFELLLNKGRNRGGASVATPATPKPPTGFALFVKENYGLMKKEHSDKVHGDIMKLLGQKFAEVKIGQRSK